MVERSTGGTGRHWKGLAILPGHLTWQDRLSRVSWRRRRSWGQKKSLYSSGSLSGHKAEKRQSEISDQLP